MNRSRDYTVSFFFFFNDTATTEIYTLSLHDALPIAGVRRWNLGHRSARKNPKIRRFGQKGPPSPDTRPISSEQMVRAEVISQNAVSGECAGARVDRRVGDYTLQDGRPSDQNAVAPNRSNTGLVPQPAPAT